MRRDVALTVIAIVCLAGATWFTSHQQAAQSFTGSHLVLLTKDGDRFRNYDYYHPTNADENGDLDWPMTVVFYEWAEVDRVKGYLNPPYSNGGMTIYGRVQDVSPRAIPNATTPYWDSDKGKKTDLGEYQGSFQEHYRLYAPNSADAMYNDSWGYYVLATTHRDYLENTEDGYSGLSEQAAGILGIYWNQAFPGHDYTQADVYDSQNYEDYHWDPASNYTHLWDNDGRMSKFYVPTP